MSRRKREPGTLPPPVSFLATLTLAGATVMAISLLPARVTQERPPSPSPVVRPPVPAVQQVVPDGPSGFVGFIDTARAPGFDLPADSRRTGVRWYALGHLVAGGDGCSPVWAKPGSTADGIELLRDMGGDVGPVLGGPAGREPAATCTRPGALVTAYRKVADTFHASYLEIEVRDSADTATVLRRARAIHVLQRERRLRVGFTLRLRPSGLSGGDIAMLRLTREAGADLATVNLLAPIEPRSAPAGRLHRLGEAVRAARSEVGHALGLTDDEAWKRLALTAVLARPSDLSESAARELVAYADRHELAWLSLRGPAPPPAVERLLWRTAD
ncbi:hypothetical protein ABT294_28925 [Nonomuraea sp. NPDC000554]|uniref:hypothetical protein n=1 Tax=Nonomuraea sp. NPDC000554 TaxID=3154259 RepID=UPI00332422D8